MLVALAVLPQVQMAAMVVLPELASLVLLTILVVVPGNAEHLPLVCRRLVACATRRAKQTQAKSVNPAV